MVVARLRQDELPTQLETDPVSRVELRESQGSITETHYELRKRHKVDSMDIEPLVSHGRESINNLEELREMRRKNRQCIPSNGSQPIRFLITLYFYILMVLTLTMSFVLQVTSFIILFPMYLISERFRVAFPGIILRFCSNCAGFYLNPFWHLDIVRGPPKGWTPSDTLVMCNHGSAADPWITSKALFPWEFKYVYKADLNRIPVAGWTILLAGDMAVHFTKEKGGWGTKPGSVGEMMKRVKKNLKLKIGTLVFPEGTRSKTGGLQPFKEGFFRLAIETGCEILPCALHNQRSLWPLGSRLIGYGNVHFAFGDPIRPLPDESVGELMHRVRTQIEGLLMLCPYADPDVDRSVDVVPVSRGHGIVGGAESEAIMTTKSAVTKSTAINGQQVNSRLTS